MFETALLDHHRRQNSCLLTSDRVIDADTAADAADRYLLVHGTLLKGRIGIAVASLDVIEHELRQKLRFGLVVCLGRADIIGVRGQDLARLGIQKGGGARVGVDENHVIAFLILKFHGAGDIFLRACVNGRVIRRKIFLHGCGIVLVGLVDGRIARKRCLCFGKQYFSVQHELDITRLFVDIKVDAVRGADLFVSRKFGKRCCAEHDRFICHDGKHASRKHQSGKGKRY